MTKQIRVLGKTVSRSTVIAVAVALLLAGVVYAALAFIAASHVSGTSVSEVSISYTGDWICSSTGGLVIESSATAADGRGVDVAFSNAQNGSKFECARTHTNNEVELVCLDLAPNHLATMFGGEASIFNQAGNSLAAGGTADRGFRVNFNSVTPNTTYASETVTMSWGLESELFGDGNASADGSCSS